MRKSFAAVLLVAFFCVGCTSRSAYVRDRARDAADIVTFAIGVGAGAKAKIGPLQTGLLADITYGGLRGGEIVTKGLEDARFDEQLILIGQEEFYGTTLQRNKNYKASTQANGVTTPLLHRVEEGGWVSAPYYTQLEAVIAFGPSIRIGFNPGELMDFLVGFIGCDIFEDDLRMIGPVRERNMAS